jgi:hypothetical protein
MAEISYLLGEGYDGLIGHVITPHAGVDGPVGVMSRLQEKFFRWNGLTWWTDMGRAVAGRMVSSEMGMRAKTAFADLPANYKHVLGLHGITEPKWEAIRKAEFREVNGKSYITPDRIRDLPDEAFAGLGKDVHRPPAMISKCLCCALSPTKPTMASSSPMPGSRRTTTLGQRPGTIAGEGIRFIMQFKGFPIAFGQRVLGRAAFGFRKGAKLEQTAHIGTMLAGLTMAGYAAMTMKDMAKGYWPPRDPTDPKTWAAAFVQGGAMGIYGDYLFSQVNRFGSGPLETAVGPAAGTASDFVKLVLKARDAGLSADEKVKAADWLNFATQNTPLVNLFYVKPTLDYLFLNSMREAATPGYSKRIEGRRLKDYGQHNMLPKPLRPFN